MGYIRKSQKSNIVDMEEYKGRKARKQTDASHNPSKNLILMTTLLLMECLVQLVLEKLKFGLSSYGKPLR